MLEKKNEFKGLNLIGSLIKDNNHNENVISL